MKRIIIPVIETSRLILRAHRITDFESSYALWANPEIVYYIGGKTSTEQQAWTRLLNYLGLWSLLGYGFWAVEKKKQLLNLSEKSDWPTSKEKSRRRSRAFQRWTG